MATVTRVVPKAGTTYSVDSTGAVVDEVQHYTKLTMVKDAQLGWVLNTDGDYILVDGEFAAA